MRPSATAKKPPVGPSRSDYLLILSQKGRQDKTKPPDIRLEAFSWPHVMLSVDQK